MAFTDLATIGLSLVGEEIIRCTYDEGVLFIKTNAKEITITARENRLKIETEYTQKCELIL